MGDKTWYYEDCPKCGGKGTVECYEQLSALLKVDSCNSCGFIQHYEVSDDDNLINIKKIKNKDE